MTSMVTGPWRPVTFMWLWSSLCCEAFIGRSMLLGDYQVRE
jgi:hypothetical protein